MGKISPHRVGFSYKKIAIFLQTNILLFAFFTDSMGNSLSLQSEVIDIYNEHRECY